MEGLRIELARELARAHARVVAYDPSLKALPEDLAREITLVASPEEALRDASVAVLATPWPAFRQLDWRTLVTAMSHATVIDAGWVLAGQLRDAHEVEYFAVGLPGRRKVAGNA